jgi:DinB superfamily
MDSQTLLALTDFCRNRLIGTLDALEKSGQDSAALMAWRPGPKRAHFAWQFMHCAATHDKYCNSYLLGKSPTDEKLVAAYGGGSTPVDDNIPSISLVRETLVTHFNHYRAYVAQCSSNELARTYKLPNGMERSVGDSILLLAWHEAHHQGQIHLMWNLYQASIGLK